MMGESKMQKRVEEFLEKYSLRTDAENRFIDLVSETGELGKEILKGNSYGKKPYENSPSVQDEIGDCLFSLIALCTEVNVDAEIALDGALSKYEKRFSQKKHIGSEE